MTHISMMTQAPHGDVPVGHATGNAPEIRSVTRASKDRVEAAMTLAFTADPVLRWAFPDALRYLEAMGPFATLFGGKSFDWGSAHVVGDFLGAAQWLPPGIQPDDGPLVEHFKRNMPEPRFDALVSVLEQMAGFHPHEPHWHLAVIGVDPLYQGRGYGSQLLRHGLTACDRDRAPAYLEASSLGNRAFYERHGFRVLGEIRSGDSPPIFPMLRDAR